MIPVAVGALRRLASWLGAGAALVRSSALYTTRSVAAVALSVSVSLTLSALHYLSSLMRALHTHPGVVEGFDLVNVLDVRCGLQVNKKEG